LDLYRFFYPFHNPRLNATPVRQQELGELEQAAGELRKAIERIQRRTRKKSIGAITPDHFDDIITGLKFVEECLQTLNEAHPGDTSAVVQEIIQERSTMSGWESWTQLLIEQIEFSKAEDRKLQKSDLDIPLKKAG
jgi:hypothetical protein